MKDSRYGIALELLLVNEEFRIVFECGESNVAKLLIV